MKKKIIIFSIIICVLCIAFAGYAWVDSEYGIGMKDVIYIRNNPDSLKKTEVLIPDVKNADKIEITNSSEIFDDGSLIFNVKSVYDNKEIGTFLYKPWVEKRSIFYRLDNGDVILGKMNIYSSKENKIIRLVEGTDMRTVFDYDVYENSLAVIAKSHSGSSDICIAIKDMPDGEFKVIDTFAYPPFNYAEIVYLGWGDDGKLYYDYAQNDTPVIKVYDMKTNSSQIFMNEARSPNISPDRKHIVVSIADSFNKNKQTKSGIQLLDLQKNIKLTDLNCTWRIFWDSEYLIVSNVDDITKWEVYDLSDSGKKVKEFNFEEQPYEMKVSNNILKIKSYKFDKSVITESEKDVVVE
ncbi:MAG TPA: hypothetical protein PK733_08590 [Clostridiales bacterium]|nr:hypothetical protein [Clostridiales bacterium]